jgi:hypothetical protein
MIETTSMELDTKYVTWDLFMSERTLRFSPSIFFHNMPTNGTGDIVILFGVPVYFIFRILLR